MLGECGQVVQKKGVMAGTLSALSTLFTLSLLVVLTLRGFKDRHAHTHHFIPQAW